MKKIFAALATILVSIQPFTVQTAISRIVVSGPVCPIPVMRMR